MQKTYWIKLTVFFLCYYTDGFELEGWMDLFRKSLSVIVMDDEFAYNIIPPPLQ